MSASTSTRSLLVPPASWRDPKKHFHSALTDPWYKLVFRLSGSLAFDTYTFFADEGFMPALMPITCHSVSSPMGLGSDSLPVLVELFGSPVYLADSMQFQLEYILRHDTEGVFYIMPTFRGEDPDSRHLNQFFHSEAELRGNLDDVISLVNRYVTFCTNRILEKCMEELNAHFDSIEHLTYLSSLKTSIPRIRYSEAVRILGSNERYYKYLQGGVKCLSNAGEQAIMSEFDGIVWLTHLPSMSVPFYQALDEDEEYALCADLLFGIGEVVGCGQRHTSDEDVLRALNKHHVDPSEYEWYVEMKRVAPMQTGGFGLGTERFLLWVLQHSDIRDIPLMSRLKHVSTYP